MEGELVREMELGAAASAFWDIYGSPKHGKLIHKLIPDTLAKLEVVEGDGGVGTIYNLVFLYGTPPFSLKEKMVKIDNEKRVKEAEFLNGGYPGFSLCRMRYEFIEKEENSCIIKQTVQFKVDSPDNLSIVAIQSQNMTSVAAAIVKHINEQKN